MNLRRNTGVTCRNLLKLGVDLARIAPASRCVNTVVTYMGKTLLVMCHRRTMGVKCGALERGKVPSNPFWASPYEKREEFYSLQFAEHAPRLYTEMVEKITELLTHRFYIPYEWWLYAVEAVLLAESVNT